MNPAAGPAGRMNAISEQGLCIGCGICQSIAGKDRIVMAKVASGDLRPVVVGELDDATVDHVYDVCPGTSARGMAPERIASDTEVDKVWGPWRRMVEAWAGDPAVRFEGSTGGVLTALAQYVLRSKRVAFILHTRTSDTDPGFGQQHYSYTEADVLAAAGSRYGPTATLVDLEDALARHEPFAFIGKPCDLTALGNQARHDPRIDTLIKYRLAMVCGGFMPPAAQDRMLEGYGIAPDRITALRYRGRGCPGPTTITTTDRVHTLHYLDFWGEDSSQWSLPFRCKICPDGIGEQADIAASDNWPGGAPDRVESETDPGTNIAVVRTRAGEELLAAAVADGALVLGREETPETLSGYQPHQVRKKYSAWPRLEGLGDEGFIRPRYEGLRLAELAAERPESDNGAQRQGTRRRVRDGKVGEPTPRLEVDRRQS
ncbi:MAG: Coenzyme F420 hydrogenase/dehydrogenase, beta subunit C-terminal domain [Rhodospirillales bacterium]